MKRKVFLLGGHDLEMIEIRKLLQQRQVEFYDRDLRWDNASLGMYTDVLEKYGDDAEVELYGVELVDHDRLGNRKNYHVIDHHGERENADASLVQVANVLQVPLNRYQQLVAANDVGYIPALQAAEATGEEIAEVRRADRAAQGVTEVEEQLAVAAIDKRETVRDLIIVQAQSSRFSPICDRLYPYEKLLIYTEKILCYYGEGKDRLVWLFEPELKQNKMYHGGGDNGYLGTVEGKFTFSEIQSLRRRIQDAVLMYSYHIFYFPFKWDVLSKDTASSFSQRIDLDLIRMNTYSPWERVFGNEKETDYLLFNEKNYFYTFVHPVLYDTGKPGTIMQHYERKEIRERDVKYVIEVKAGHDSKYELQVDDLIINLYSTGVGILIFYLKNELYTNPEDVLRINQFGRRMFPPFLGINNSVEASKGTELADKIYLQGLFGSSDRYFEDFEDYKTPNEAWKPAKFIQSLVTDLSEDFVIIPYEGKRDVSLLQPHELERGVMPAIDDRMFVASLIFDDRLCKRISAKASGFKDLYDDFWLRYVLVDAGSPCIQNEEMSRDFLHANTYLRWQKWGTIYGYSRYSFVGISSTDFGRKYLQPQYKTMYSRMFELALIQRASVLKFSGEVSRLSNLSEQDSRLIGKISDLYREYIRFVNQVYFREVTAQEQGTDMYRALQQQINLEEQVKSLDGEIEELHQYAILIEDRNQNKKLGQLTQIGGMFIIPSLLVGYFGMNIFSFKADDAVFLASSFIVGLLLTFGVFSYLLFFCKEKVWRVVSWIIIVLIVLGMLALTFFIERS